MNEIKIETNNSDYFGILFAALLFSCFCGAVIYYYRGADGQLEHEFGKVERLNTELASETRQLQAELASHSTGIKTVRNEIGTSRKRIEYIHIEIAKSANDADRAISIIEDCEKIINEVKAQK